MNTNFFYKLNFSFTGLVIPAGSFVLLSYLDQSQVTLAVVLLIIAVGVNSAIFSGLYLNPMDICPNHCAQIFGVMSGLANFASFLSPLAAQVVISDEVCTKSGLANKTRQPDHKQNYCYAKKLKKTTYLFLFNYIWVHTTEPDSRVSLV